MEQPLHCWLPPSGGGFETIHGGHGPRLGREISSRIAELQYLERLHLEEGRVAKRDRLLEGVGRVRDIARNQAATCLSQWKALEDFPPHAHIPLTLPRVS